MPARERPPLYRNDYGAFKYENQEMCTYEKKKSELFLACAVLCLTCKGTRNGEKRGNIEKGAAVLSCSLAYLTDADARRHHHHALPAHDPRGPCMYHFC